MDASRIANYSSKSTCIVVALYIVVHNLLRAHASVVALYRTKYQGLQGGWIGLNVYGVGCSPLTNSTADVEATQRALDFYIGWILHPLVFGDYPEIMKKNAGLRLPPFTKRESELIKGSFDFIGLNYYTSVYVGDTSNSQKLEIRDYTADMFAIFAVSKNATPTGKYVPSYVPIDPLGLLKFLEYLKQDYGNPPIYIQENGYGLGTNNTINDTKRIEFLSGYIGSTLDAIKNGSDVRGYFVWSFMDVLEFLGGYTTRCGLYYVDYEDKERRRLPKQSAHWYAKFLKKSDKELSMKSADLDGTLHFQE